eukprot:364721-Chlamydomonas_euryale.AAC.11
MQGCIHQNIYCSTKPVRFSVTASWILATTALLFITRCEVFQTLSWHCPPHDAQHESEQSLPVKT